MRDPNRKSYLEFLKLLYEWKPQSSNCRVAPRTRLALYACTFDGPECQGQTKHVPSDVGNKKFFHVGATKNFGAKSIHIVE
jgi:hypothetical protein